MIIPVIVIGHEAHVTVEPTDTIRTVMVRATKETKYDQYPFFDLENWEARNSQGIPLDPTLTVATADLNLGELMYISPYPGVGG